MSTLASERELSVYNQQQLILTKGRWPDDTLGTQQSLFEQLFEFRRQFSVVNVILRAPFGMYEVLHAKAPPIHQVTYTACDIRCATVRVHFVMQTQEF